MKYLILIGDGMGDYPIAELAGKTPLEAAETPMMDELCRKGELFLTHTVPEGYPPGSDVANMSLLGYDPAACYTGRAPLEAAAMGIRLAADEIAFRCNLVTLGQVAGQGLIMHDFSAGHISSAEGAELIAALEAACSGDQFHFHPGVGYRHLLISRGEHPGFVTVPPHDHIGKEVSTHFQEYLNQPAWRQLLETARQVLADHPVNHRRLADGKSPASLIWPWGEGRMPSLPTLIDRFAISGSMISAVDLLKGLGVLGGLTICNVPGATGYLDTNYAGKAEAALIALKTQDLAFVHVEAPDETGHQGLLAEKIRAIEDFDGKIVAPIIAGLRARGETFRVVTTMDHFTPLSLRTHVSDPVPTLLYDSRELQPGSGRSFSEKDGREHDAHHGGALTAGHRLIEKLLLRL
jgi:2,3-bisphosphoglycerate-independent phosphoglycerate mutase